MYIALPNEMDGCHRGMLRRGNLVRTSKYSQLVDTLTGFSFIRKSKVRCRVDFLIHSRAIIGVLYLSLPINIRFQTTIYKASTSLKFGCYLNIIFIYRRKPTQHSLTAVKCGACAVARSVTFYRYGCIGWSSLPLRAPFLSSVVARITLSYNCKTMLNRQFGYRLQFGGRCAAALVRLV